MEKSDMTCFKQLVTEYLDDNREVCEELMYGVGYVKDWESDSLPFEYKGVDSHGGEDQGSDFYSVMLVRNPNNRDEKYHVKFQGWYASYSGAEYNNWSFVEPKQKTITVYS